MKGEWKKMIKHQPITFDDVWEVITYTGVALLVGFVLGYTICILVITGSEVKTAADIAEASELATLTEDALGECRETVGMLMEALGIGN